MKQKIKIRRNMTGMLLAVCLAFPMTAWAGTWEAQESGEWKYEEDGAYAADWIQVDGIWYYMDPDTALWVRRPSLTDTVVCHLLENAVTRAGWYAGEERPMIYFVESRSGSKAVARIMLETAPMEAGTTLDTFDVDLRRGTAKARATKLELDLYSY